MSAVSALEIALGALLLALTLYDVFQSVVMPRPAVGRLRLSVTLVPFGWRLWRAIAGRMPRLQTRESLLAAFGPLSVVTLLVLWGFLLILGYALIDDGLRSGLQPRPTSLGEAIFFSAGRMLAFNVHGIEATGTFLQVLTGLEAATGFGLFALVISLLFSLFTAFQRRESAVVELDALAGAPPSGVQLLERCAQDQMPEQLAATLAQWRAWTVDVLESHLSYPLLFYFRSSHDNEAWPNSFGAVMDAATLVLSTIQDGPVGPARLMYKVGSHLVGDMRQYYYGDDGEAAPFVEREEFLEACERLHRAGYRLHDKERAWQQFSELRSKYAPWLNQSARGLAITPAPWIGDRSYLPHRERRPRAGSGRRGQRASQEQAAG